MKPKHDENIDILVGSENKSSFKIDLAALKKLRTNFNDKNRTCYLEFTPIAPIYDSEGNNIAVDTGLNKGWTMFIGLFKYNTSSNTFTLTGSIIKSIIPYTFLQIDFVSMFTEMGGNINGMYPAGRAPYLQISVNNTLNTNYKLHNLRLYADDGAIVSMSNIINNLPSDLRTGLSGLDSEMLNRTVPVGDLKTVYTECNNSDRYSVLDVYGNRIWQNNREIRYADCKFPTTKPVYFAMEGLEGGKGDKYNINNGEYSYSGGFANQLNIIAAQQKAEPICGKVTSDSSSSSTTDSSSSSNSSTTANASTYAGLPSTPPMVCTFNVLNTNWINTPHNDHEWSTTDTSVQSKYNPHEFKSINNKGVPMQITIQKSISSSEAAKEPVIELYSMTYSASSSPKVKIGTKRETITYSTKYLYNNYSSAAGQSISVYNFIFNFKATSNTYIKVVGGGNEIVHVESENNVSEDEKLLFEFIRGKCFTVAPGDPSRGIEPRKVSFLDFNGYIDENNNFTVVDMEELLTKRKSKYYSKWERDDNNNFIDPVYGKKIIVNSSTNKETLKSTKINDDGSISTEPFREARILSQSEWRYMVHRKDDKGYLVMNITPKYGDDKLYNHLLNNVVDSKVGLTSGLIGTVFGSSLVWFFTCLSFAETWNTLWYGTNVAQYGYLSLAQHVNEDYLLVVANTTASVVAGVLMVIVWCIIVISYVVEGYKDTNETIFLTYVLPDDFEAQLDRLQKLANINSHIISDVKKLPRATNELLDLDCAPYTVIPILEAIGAKAILPIGYYEASSNWQVNHGYALAGVGGYGYDISKVRSVYYSGPENTNDTGNAQAWTKYRNRKYPIYPVYDYNVIGISDYNLNNQDYSGLYILYNTHHDNGKDSSDMRIITQWCGWGQTYDPTDFPYNGSYHANLLDSRFKSCLKTSATGFLLVDYTYNTVMKGMFKSSNVTWLEFPSNLHHLVFEDYVFDGCQYLKNIYLNPTKGDASGRGAYIYISQNTFANIVDTVIIIFNGTQTEWNKQYRSYNNDNTTLPVNVSRIVCLK